MKPSVDKRIQVLKEKKKSLVAARYVSEEEQWRRDDLDLRIFEAAGRDDDLHRQLWKEKKQIRYQSQQRELDIRRIDLDIKALRAKK